MCTRVKNQKRAFAEATMPAFRRIQINPLGIKGKFARTTVDGRSLNKSEMNGSRYFYYRYRRENDGGCAGPGGKRPSAIINTLAAKSIW